MGIHVVVVRGVARAEGVDACCLLLSSAITICSCISLQKVHVTAPHLLTGHPPKYVSSSRHTQQSQPALLNALFITAQRHIAWHLMACDGNTLAAHANTLPSAHNMLHLRAHTSAPTFVGRTNT